MNSYRGEYSSFLYYDVIELQLQLQNDCAAFSASGTVTAPLEYESAEGVGEGLQTRVSSS